MCPSDSAIRAVSALCLELVTMERNVQRQQSIVGWDEVFIRRNVGQSGMSPNIHPPFKAVTPWHLMKRNGAEVNCVDVTSSTRVPPVKIHHQFQCMNIIPRFPGVVFNTKTLPLHQVTKFPVNHPTIQDFLHYPLFFTINNFWKWRQSCPSARNRVQWSQKTIWPHWRQNEVDSSTEGGRGSTHCY